MATLHGQEIFRSLHPPSLTHPCLHCLCMTSLPAALTPVQIRGAPSSSPGLLQPMVRVLGICPSPLTSTLASLLSHHNLLDSLPQKTAFMLSHQDSHRPQDRLLTPRMASWGLFGRHPHHPHRPTDEQLRRWRMWRSHWCDHGFTSVPATIKARLGVWPVSFLGTFAWWWLLNRAKPRRIRCDWLAWLCLFCCHFLCHLSYHSTIHSGS